MKVSPIEGWWFLESGFFVVKAYTVPPEFVVFLGGVLYGPNFGKTGSYLGDTNRGFSIFETDDNTVYDYT